MKRERLADRYCNAGYYRTQAEGKKILKGNLDFKNKLNEQIQKNENRYEIILEKKGKWYTVTTSRRINSTGLARLRRLRGYTPEELKGAGVDFWTEHVHPEDRDKLWKNCENHMKNEGNFRLEYRFRKKNDY